MNLKNLALATFVTSVVAVLASFLTFFVAFYVEPSDDFVVNLKKDKNDLVNFIEKFKKFYESEEENIKEPQETLVIDLPKLPKVSAIYFGNSLRSALLILNKEKKWVKEGEVFKEWRIKEISPFEVTLEFKGTRKVVRLFEKRERVGDKERRVRERRKEVVGKREGGTFVISREEVERLTADMGSLFSGIRLRPYVKGSVTKGIRVDYVSPRSIFYRAGLRSGDIILSVNDIPTRTNEDAFRILETIKTSSFITVKVLRQGKIITLKAEVR